MSVAGRGSVHAQARIDREIQQVDDQIDDHENEGDQAKVGGHDRDVGTLHCLDEQQSHAGPPEHGIGDDRKRHDGAQLQARDRDDGAPRGL